MAVDDIRYVRLGYVALNVTDLDRSRHFYEKLVGLTVDAPDNGERLYLRCSDQHHDIALYKSAEPGLKRTGWEMESKSALNALRSHLSNLGLKIFAVPAEEALDLGIDEGFRISEPTTGATFEFYVGMARAQSPYVTTHTKIARLGHAVLVSTDRPATEKWILENLNFRCSDRIDGAITFMRCFPNPYHHSFGVAAGPKVLLNHVNFMVSEMADVGKANNRMKANNVPIVFGIGKHPPSESVFLYFLDPDGITIEYSFGMEEFPEADARDPRNLPASLESLDYWGGVPDPRSGSIGAVEHLGETA